MADPISLSTVSGLIEKTFSVGYALYQLTELLKSAPEFISDLRVECTATKEVLERVRSNEVLTTPATNELLGGLSKILSQLQEEVDKVYAQCRDGDIGTMARAGFLWRESDCKPKLVRLREYKASLSLHVGVIHA